MAAYRKSFSQGSGFTSSGTRPGPLPDHGKVPLKYEPIIDENPSDLTRHLDVMAKKACQVGDIQRKYLTIPDTDCDSVLTPERNGFNVPMSTVQIEKLRRLMRNGLFQPSALTPLKFNHRGAVISAQHRLMAQKLEGLTFTYLVEVGYPAETDVRDVTERTMTPVRRVIQEAKLVGSPYEREDLIENVQRFGTFLAAYAKGRRDGASLRYEPLTDDQKCELIIGNYDLYMAIKDVLSYRRPKLFKLSKDTALAIYAILTDNNTRNQTEVIEFLNDLFASHHTYSVTSHLATQLALIPGAQRFRDPRYLHRIIEAFNAFKTNRKRSIAPTWMRFEEGKILPPMPLIK